MELAGVSDRSSFRNQLRALIVDDNLVVRKILNGYLESLGVETQEAVNGKEAVDLVAGGAKFNLVLMDKEMPVMDGPEATRRLRAMGVTAKIVGVSGNSGDDDIKEFLEAGAEAYYIKPVTILQLSRLLRDIDHDL